MSMSRMHFVAIANIINDQWIAAEGNPSEEGVVIEIAGGLADYFKTVNPHFDRARFLRACGVQ